MYDPVFVGDIANDPDNVPTAGLVPAPEHGDANRNFYLSASGVWKAPTFWEPISLIKVPASGCNNITVSKLGGYDFIKVTLVDVLPDLAGVSKLVMQLKRGTTPVTSGYYQKVYGATAATGAITQNNSDIGTGSFWSLADGAETPDTSNSLMGRAGSPSSFYVGEFIFNNFSNPSIYSLPEPNMFGRYTFMSNGYGEYSGVTFGRLSTSSYVDGLFFGYGGGGAIISKGSILVEGVRNNAAYNNNFTTFT